MERQLIELLISGRRKPRAAQVGGYALVRAENGLEKVALAKLEVGQFEGKQGTPRRSRKGRTYRAPNGRRFMAHQWEKPEVVLYRL